MVECPRYDQFFSMTFLLTSVRYLIYVVIYCWSVHALLNRITRCETSNSTNFTTFILITISKLIRSTFLRFLASNSASPVCTTLYPLMCTWARCTNFILYKKEKNRNINICKDFFVTEELHCLYTIHSVKTSLHFIFLIVFDQS